MSLYDERTFEHEFLLQIETPFPLLEKLTMVNKNNKMINGLDNQKLSIIKYLHLKLIDLVETHKDYYEQFLLDIKMCLLNDIRINMNYPQMEKVPRNFTRKISQNRYRRVYIVTNTLNIE